MYQYNNSQRNDRILGFGRPFFGRPFGFGAAPFLTGALVGSALYRPYYPYPYGYPYFPYY